MRFGRKTACFFTLIMLIPVLLLCIRQVRIEKALSDDIEIPLSFLVGGTEEVKLWEGAKGKFYVFLPAYSDMKSVSFSLENNTHVLLGKQQIRNGMTCETYDIGQEYDFSYEKQGVKCEGSITFLQSEDIPSLHIDVQSGSMDYIHLEKGNEENAEFRLYEANGQLLYSDAMKIKGRGNSSWGASKKPYSLTLAKTADLLGMGGANKWVLLAEGYNPVAVRNKIVYDFAAEVGLAYTPECKWVDLYLNGEYAGLYELSERNEVHPERVDISPEDGSFLVSMEYESRLIEQKYPYVLTDSGQALRVHYGANNLQNIQKIWQSVENAVLANDGVDPVSGKHWREMIDVDSWARKYLIEEIFGNLDAGSLSQFYYFDSGISDGKIYAGPVWDYDFSMGGEDVWLKPYTNYFAMNRAEVNDEIYTPWFASLYQQEAFLTRVKEIYVLEFLPKLEVLIDKKLDEYADLIQASSEMSRIRCHWKFVEKKELQEEYEYIKSFLTNRIAFLSDIWLNEVDYHTVCVRASVDGNFVVKDGDLLPELLRSDNVGGLGWYDLKTGEPFDINQPIYEDVTIYVKQPESTLPKVHFIPIAVIMMILPTLLLLDRKRNKQNGRPKHESAKVR